MNEIVAALDLGTTKICAVIGEKLDNGKIRILGTGVVPSEGMHKGLIMNVTKTAEAIQEAIGIAANRAGVEITKVNVGIAGEHIITKKMQNYVMISNDDHEIKASDLVRLENDVRAGSYSEGKEIIHIIPEEYKVDEESGIKNPIGMLGHKLEATSLVVLAGKNQLVNMRRSVERAGFAVDEFLLQPIASSMSVLDENEKDLGVLLIDIGGGTTDIAVFHRKALKRTHIFGIAGNLVTNDIREALSIVTPEAEKMKKNFGYASQNSIIRDEMIPLKGVGALQDREISVSLLTQIIHARMRELFTFIENDLKSNNLRHVIKAGIIITGGGCLLRGCDVLAQEVFDVPSRIGMPLDIFISPNDEVQKPEFSTALGLLRGMPGKKKPEAEGPKDDEKTMKTVKTVASTTKERSVEEESTDEETTEDKNWFKKTITDIKTFFKGF